MNKINKKEIIKIINRMNEATKRIGSQNHSIISLFNEIKQLHDDVTNAIKDVLDV